MEMIAPPREGLPPCVRGRTELGDRLAQWNDRDRCPDFAEHLSGSGADLVHAPRFCVVAGIKGDEGGLIHASYPAVSEGDLWLKACCLTDDPAEAEAAYTRGCEFVLTGVLPLEVE